MAGFQGDKQAVHVPGFRSRHGDDDLRQHIQGAFYGPGAFNIVFSDPTGKHSCLKNIMGMGGKQHPLAGRIHTVSCPSQALKCRCDGGWRLNQNDFIQCTDINTEFERVGGYDSF